MKTSKNIEKYIERLEQEIKKHITFFLVFLHGKPAKNVITLVIDPIIGGTGVIKERW